MFQVDIQPKIFMKSLKFLKSLINLKNRKILVIVKIVYTSDDKFTLIYKKRN